MSQVKWTDERVERELALCAVDKYGARPSSYRDALLELKRVRAWIKHMLNAQEIEFGHEYCGALLNVLSGDPAPTDEQEAGR